MRILICTINFAPDMVGIGKYSGEMAEWLAGRGHQVRVVTAPPYYPQWKTMGGYRAYLYRKERIAGASVWRCPIWVPRRVTGMTRVLHLLSFALSSAPVLMALSLWRPAVVLTVEPPLAAAPAAWLAARMSRCLAWLHVQDFEVDAAFDLGIIRSPRGERAIRAFESWLMRRFDRVSTISGNMLERLGAKQVDADRRFLFPNWVDTAAIYPLPGPSPMRERLGLGPEDTVALYSGNIGLKQGLEVVVEAARRLKIRPSLKFVICGQGAGLAALRRIAEGVENIRWLPLQPVEDLNDLLNCADIHLLPQRSDAADLVMPSKLTGMLASGRSVLATALPGSQIWLAVQGCGIVVPPEDVDAFVAALEALDDAPADRRRMGENARAYAIEHLSKDSVLSRFEAELAGLVSTA